MRNDDQGKRAAARHAAGLVESGMVVGLGTGSTAAMFVEALGERVRAGLRVAGVPTSESTARQATAAGIPLTTLEAHPHIDLDVDGADAIDPALGLLKGLGGALLREKIVAAASTRFAVIATADKLVEHLSKAPVVPVEVVPFGWSRTREALGALGGTATLRMRADDPTQPFVSDGGHYVLDTRFGVYPDAGALAMRIKALTGVVDHGFFIGLATECILGQADGTVRVMRATRA